MAHLCFGNSLLIFSTFYVSMWTCTRFVLGDFEHSELPYVNGRFAPVFYYRLTVLMVSFNMAVAIIADAYEKLRDRQREVDMRFEELCEAKAQNSGSKHYLDAIVKLGLGVAIVVYLVVQK